MKSKKTTDQKESGQSLFSVSAITRLLALPGVGVLLLIKTVCGVPIGILQSMFSVGEMRTCVNRLKERNGKL